MSENEGEEGPPRDTVLADFMSACPTPTASDVRRWMKEHPDRAVAIGELAATMIELSIYRAPGPLATPTEAEVERAHAMTADTMRGLGVDLGETVPSLKDLFARAGSSVPQIEAETGVPREVVGAMEAGWMSPPVAPRILAALAAALRVKSATVAAAVAAAAAAPRGTPAKATGRPTVTQRTCRQIVEDSSLSEERKAHWLGED